jgi:hypothetical protein
MDLIPRTVTDRDKRSVIIYGTTKGKKCKECDFLKEEIYSKVYNRCTCPKYVKVDNKNWKVETEACGFFEEKK